MNAKAKHTPGPWRPAGRIGGWDGVTSADGTDICHLEYNEPANATLISAAPDLLGALRELVAINDGHGPFGGDMYRDRIDRAWDRARDALAKAVQS